MDIGVGISINSAANGTYGSSTGKAGAIGRQIATLSGSQYGQVVEPYVFAGDFEIEREVAIPDETLSTFQVLIGSSSSDDSIAAKSDGTVQTNIAGTLLNTIPVTINPYDGKVHIWKIKRVGNTGTLLIDGIVQITGTVLTGNSTWDVLWANTGTPTNFFQGQDLSYQFTDNGVPLPRVVLDSGSIYYQLPRGESLGANSILNGFNLVNTDNWSPLGSATLSAESGMLKILNTAVSFGGGEQVISLAAGTYVASCDYDHDGSNTRSWLQGGTTSGAVDVFNTDTGVISNTATGTLLVIFTLAAPTDIYFHTNIININGIHGLFGNIKQQQLPDNALILKNFALTDWSRYTLQRNIAHDGGTVTLAWVGDNVVANGRFAADTDWTKGVGWTIASGKASSDGSQAGASDLAQASLVDENSRYLQKITASNISAGGVKQLSGGGLGANITADGSHIEIITASSGAASGAQADINFVGSVDNISIQHLLEVI